ncbi:hypothetical protein M9H77_35965 [Catharanthus roseus]|uniref:Uncharacterized protein n=1 Tax=Catharanthus roseus TaxID=4058 RepID=A0ACB9ZU74_CATRO|nr:hypothetical protein M9H77_35965 [Catharanthus roseus]
MSCLVAKQPNTLFPPINKGLSKVERAFRRHSSLRQMKSSLEALPKMFLIFFLPKIEESHAASQSINHPQSPFDLRRSFQAFNKTKVLSQKEVQNSLAPKALSFTKQDDESSSTGSDNEVHHGNPMYESSMARDSTSSSVSPVMMTRTLSTKEQLANLTRLVEGLAKQFDAVKVGIDGFIISMNECQAHVEIPPTNEELAIKSISQYEKLPLEDLAKQQNLTMPLTKVEPVKALDTLLKGFVQPTEDAKMEGSKTVKMLDTSSKYFDKLPTSHTSDRFDPNSYRLLAKEASKRNGNTTKLGYKCASPILLKIKRATTQDITTDDEVTLKLKLNNKATTSTRNFCF